MNVSNGVPGQNNNVSGGLNTQPGQGIQGQQGMGNTQQANLNKPNSQMGNMQQNNMGTVQQGYQQQTQGMGYQQQQGTMYQQQTQGMGYNPNVGYQQTAGQMGYAQQVYPVMPTKSTLGLVGLILSIVSLICCGPVMAIPGLICSIIALVKNKKETRALIGTIIAVISIVLWIILWVTGVVSLNKLTFTDSNGNEYDLLEEVEDDYDYEDDDYVVEDDNDYEVEDNNDDYTIEEEDIIVEEDNNSEDNEVAGNTGNDVAASLDPSSVVYNGITLTMGEYTASEIETMLGYDLDDEDMEYVVNPGYYTYATYWVEKSSWDDEEEHFDRIIYFYFVNNTEEAIPMSECVLYKLNFYSSDYFDGDTLADWCNVDLGPEITVNSTVDDIIGVLGEPDSDYENEEYNTCSIKYYEMYDYMWSVEFDFKDGKMTEITIGAYQ